MKTDWKREFSWRVWGLMLCLVPLSAHLESGRRPYRDAALAAARWISASAVKTDSGVTWPGVPGDRRSINNTLYSGTPGVVLFYLEAYHATGDRTFLERARAGADYLLATLEQEKGTGLYTGVAGVGLALLETHKTADDLKYRRGVEDILKLLKDRAEPKDRGIEWSGTTDIISGTAGTGLFLLHAGKELDKPDCVDLAAEAGLRLVDLARPAEGGLKWAMDPAYPRLMPNFSHGTAGIAYFLASLYMSTRNREFLDAALAGAGYLRAVARTDDDTCLIFHHEPEGEDLFYLGWCHGPVGTGRLFYRLHEITGEDTWLEWAEKGGRALLRSGIPEKQTPGFWNNVGVCCGSAGVADYALSLYQVTRKTDYLEFARRLTAQILNRSTQESGGMKWIQAEHRSRPEFLQAQTGLMQGAAGIGLWLLRLDAFEEGRAARIVFPDRLFGLENPTE
jgi:lantibiotic modifying enzyme